MDGAPEIAAKDDAEGEVLVQTPSLAMRYVPGTGSRLVLSFRGLPGQRGGGGGVESFWGSIRQGGQNHLLFIADVAQSWYNERGVAREIRTQTQAIIDRVQPRQIFALGNSMGGYGAIAFSRDFPFDQVLAICPQATLDQNAVRDRRWGYFARRVRNFRMPHIRDCIQPTTRYTVIMGGRGLERVQSAEIPQQDNIRHFQMRGYYHAVAEGLKAKGLLKPIVHSFLNSEQHLLERQIRDAGGVEYRG